jgi:hypothetical protein
MTRDRQKKRKRLRAAQPPPPRAPELAFTPGFYALAELHRERMQQLFGAKEQWSREECSLALDQLIAEGVLALDL